MKNILSMWNKNKFFCFFCTVFTVITLSILFIKNMNYAVVFDDDIKDTFANRYSHYRYLTTWLVFFFVKILPANLNIHIQEFSFVSEVLFKVVLFSLIVLSITFSFFRFNKNYILFSIIYSITFFLAYSLPNLVSYRPYLEVNIFFIGYFFPIVFFILFWYKMSDYYIACDLTSNKLSKKEKFILFFYSVLIFQGNEILLFISSIFSFLLFIDLFIFEKNKNFEKNKYVLFPLISFLIIDIFILLFPGDIITDVYNISFYIPNIHEIKTFANLFWIKIFYENMYLWILNIIGILLLLKIDDKGNKHRILKFCLFSYLSILIICVSCLFLAPNCPYTEYKIKSWILCPHIIMQVKMLLFLICLYISGILTVSEINIFKKLRYFNYFLITILLISCIIYLIPFFKYTELRTYYNPQMKKLLYISDKISLFYLKQGKTIIFPYNKYIQNSILNVNISGSLENYNNEIFHKTDDVAYLKYLEIIYKIDTSPGIMLMDTDKAISLYFKNGGRLTTKEIENMDFSKLNNN